MLGIATALLTSANSCIQVSDLYKVFESCQTGFGKVGVAHIGALMKSNKLLFYASYFQQCLSCNIAFFSIGSEILITHHVILSTGPYTEEGGPVEPPF